MLLGRDSELEMLAAFVTGSALGSASSDSAVYLIAGDPGIGKTALLDAAAENAERAGRVVLRVTALEYEAELAFAALNQLLLPLLDDLPGVDLEVHRWAIALICGLEPGAPPSQLIAGAATLALVTSAARRRPLLFVIDDVPWLDLASGMVLAYLARRLKGVDARLLVAARSELENVFVRSGFQAHILPPLADADADVLLRTSYPALPVNVRRRIRAEAGGNPLALLDLPAALDGVGPALPELLPLTDRLRSLYARRLRDLPVGTREMLLFVVLAGAENSMTLEHCLPAPEAGVNLGPAERAGIVRAHPRSGRMEFRHPLIRAAVFELSTGAERRSAHALLAEAFTGDPARRAWHLGQSADTPDEEVAALLETVSQQLLESGHSTRATAALARAAELTPAPGERARRVAHAAYLGSLVTGDLLGSARLLVQAQPAPGQGPPLAMVTAAAHQLLNAEGDTASSQRLLITALDAQLGSLDPADMAAMEALQTLIFVGFYAGRAEFWADTRRQLARVVPPMPDTLAVFDAVFADPARADADAVKQLDQAIDGLRFTADPVRITRIAAAGAYLDRIRFAREPLSRVVEDGRRGGAVAKQIEALFLLANDDYFTGEWDDVETATDEGVALCDDLGYVITAAPGRYLRALVDSARGRTAAADRAAEQILMWAAPRRLYTLAAYASHIRCMEALAEQQFEPAYRHAASISPAGTLGLFQPLAVWLVFDLVEAASRSGHTTQAREHTRAAEASGLGMHSSRLDLLTTAAGALTDPDNWSERFRQALATPGSERWVFDRARVQLVFGEQLRRSRALGQARTELTSAIAGFRRLRATPWTRRATRELRAAGGADPGSGVLTPQEAAIADLVATGLTNKQIATQLFLSPRTVSTHLSHAYTKLGITSRAAMRDAIDHPKPHLGHRPTSFDG
jgi:DNA-binding CsgD family transcriptional regulator